MAKKRWDYLVSTGGRSASLKQGLPLFSFSYPHLCGSANVGCFSDGSSLKNRGMTHVSHGLLLRCGMTPGVMSGLLKTTERESKGALWAFLMYGLEGKPARKTFEPNIRISLSGTNKAEPDPHLIRQSFFFPAFFWTQANPTWNIFSCDIPTAGSIFCWQRSDWSRGTASFNNNKNDGFHLEEICPKPNPTCQQI